MRATAYGERINQLDFRVAKILRFAASGRWSGWISTT